MTEKGDRPLPTRVTGIVDWLRKPFQSSTVADLVANEFEDQEVVSINTIATLKQMKCADRISEGKPWNASDWSIIFEPGDECTKRKCRFATVIKSGDRKGLTRCERTDVRRKIS